MGDVFVWVRDAGSILAGEAKRGKMTSEASVLSRRKLVSLLLGLPLLLSLTACGEKNVLDALRNILRTVEKALDKFYSMTGLAGSIVEDIKKYLQAVTRYVGKAAEILEDDAIQNADKANQLIMLAAAVVMPTLPNQAAQAVLMTVANALQMFLALFKDKSTSELSSFGLSDSEHMELQILESEAAVDALAVGKWAEEYK
jgi:hypothetical protein